MGGMTLQLRRAVAVSALFTLGALLAAPVEAQPPRAKDWWQEFARLDEQQQELDRRQQALDREREKLMRQFREASWRFELADADASGHIEQNEAEAIPEVAARFEDADRNDDGKLSLAEFRNHVAPFLQTMR